MMSADAIVLKDVSKKYLLAPDEQVVLKSVSVSIPDGQRVAVVGPNGSGKSTFLRIVLGLVKPDTGTVSVGVDQEHKQVAFIPQDYRNALFPWLRVRSNLALHVGGVFNRQSWIGLGVSTEKRDLFKAAAGEIQVKIDLEKFPYQLSGGEQQILVLLHAMFRKPKLLVADEPFSAIDMHKKERVLNHFSRWLTTNTPTMLFVSHDLEDALLLADRVVVLSRTSGYIEADILVDKPHPRPFDWRYSDESRKALKQIIDAFGGK